jgi:hypothetical protein
MTEHEYSSISLCDLALYRQALRLGHWFHGGVIAVQSLGIFLLARAVFTGFNGLELVGGLGLFVLAGLGITRFQAHLNRLLSPAQWQFGNSSRA